MLIVCAHENCRKLNYTYPNAFFPHAMVVSRQQSEVNIIHNASNLRLNLNSFEAEICFLKVELSGRLYKINLAQMIQMGMTVINQ